MKQVPTQVQVTFKFARMRTADNSIYFILNATYCITVQRLLQSTELFVKKTVCLVHVAHLDPVIQYIFGSGYTVCIFGSGYTVCIFGSGYTVYSGF